MFLNFLESLRDENGSNHLLLDTVKTAYLESHTITEGKILNRIGMGAAALGALGSSYALSHDKTAPQGSEIAHEVQLDPVGEYIKKIEQIRSTNGDDLAYEYMSKNDKIYNFEEDVDGKRYYHVMGGFVYDQDGKIVE